MSSRLGPAIGAAALALSLGAGPASAHHSFAMFDRGEGREQTIQGTVQEFSLMNPHGWFKVNVVDGQKRTALWSFEMASVMQLRKLGWTNESVKLGDRVSVTYYPLRFGSYGGQFVSAVLSDGRTVKGLAEADRGFPTSR